MRQVLAERGYAKASVQAIGRAAGVTPGLVHYHFASKEDVLVSLVEEMVGHVMTRYEARVVTEGSRLFALLDALTDDDDFEAGLRVRCWVAIGAEAVVRDEVRAVYAKAVNTIIEALEHELFARAPNRQEARKAAVALISAVEGYFHLAAACPDVVPPGSAREAVRSMATGLVEAWS
jgi:TetR/AcrR family transcriptional repressor of bet genes